MKQTILLAALVFAICSFASGQLPSNKAKDDLLKVEMDFAEAIVNNDAKAIGTFIADEWVIIDSDGNRIDKDTFLAAVKSGTLTHSSMQSKEVRIRIFNDDSAVVSALTTSKGKYMGKEFTSVERSTDFFAKKDGRWQCVFSQLTRSPAK